jgi:hypothetical protein
MNTKTIPALLAVLVVASHGCTQNRPSEGGPTLNTLSAAERAAGWRLLFDGRTTDGWHNYGKSGISSGWKVQDGALTRADTGAGDIITNDEFRNFEFTIEWKVARAGNSGIFYRASEEKDDAIYWNAPEMQVLDDANHPDGGSRLTSAGANYGLYPAPAGVVRPAGEWNAARLVVNGNHVEHWLNGVKVVDYELGSADWEAKVKASKFVDHPKYGRNAAGHIGLQDHGDLVSYRNIKVRALP